MQKRFHPLPLLLVCVGLLAAVAVLWQRHRAEGRSRAVALVLDYAQFRSLVAATGTPLDQAYRDFKGAGVTGIAVTEESLADLHSDGTLEVDLEQTPTGREYRVKISDPMVAARVAEYVPQFLRGATERAPAGDRVVLPGPGGGSIYLPGRFEDVRGAPTGLDVATLLEVRNAKLEPIGRLNNPLGSTERSLRWELARTKELGVRVVIFAGEEVLGYRELVAPAARAFRDLNLLYGSVEFGKQRGDEQLSRLLQDRLVRVHSIAAAEMPRLTALEAVERYVRAAEERNIRLNYVRLPVSATPRTYADSVDYVRSIARGLVHSKLGLGSPLAFSEVWPHPLAGRVAAAAVALGIGGGAVLLLAGLVPLALERQATLGIVAGLGCALAAGSGVNMAVQLLALLAAVTFPMLAFVLFPQPVGAFDGHPYAETRERRSGLLSAVLEFLLLSAVTLAGAGMVAALLSELPYLVKVRAFSGIKLAHVAPLLLVAWIYLTGMSGEYPSWRVERDAIAQRLRDFFNEPIRVWHTVAMLVGLVALALLVARTGNDAGIGVSPTELRFRALLDRVLGVRPRTKEFLVGHPALLLALLLAARPRWRLVALPLLLVGVIGQVSMLNSFCHLHSPIKLTLARTWNGVWSGGLIGLALILFWLWLAPRLGGVLPPRRSQARAPDEYQTV